MLVKSLVEVVAPAPELIVWHGARALLKRIFKNLFNNPSFF